MSNTSTVFKMGATFPELSPEIGTTSLQDTGSFTVEVYDYSEAPTHCIIFNHEENTLVATHRFIEQVELDLTHVLDETETVYQAINAAHLVILKGALNLDVHYKAATLSQDTLDFIDQVIIAEASKEWLRGKPLYHRALVNEFFESLDGEQYMRIVTTRDNQMLLHKEVMSVIR